VSARFVFVAGKGGVGKTTLAASRAVRFARAGKDVVVVSTDPAHSLADAFALPLTKAPKRLGARRLRGRLRALHLDADAALARWLDEQRRALRLVAGHGTWLDDDDIDSFLDLSFPGVDELMALLELDRLARDLAPDVVVVDTAPTGHTLRLLQMPETLARLSSVLEGMQQKHRVVQASLAGRSREDAGDALIDALAGDAARLEALLRDPRRATFSWVTLAEPLSLAEAKDGVGALDDAGLVVDEVVVNRVLVDDDDGCAFCAAARAAQACVVGDIAAAFGDRAAAVVPLQEREPRGLLALGRLKELPFPQIAKRRTSKKPRAKPKTRPASTSDASSAPVISLCAEPKKLVNVAGKGGVGKTSGAAATALREAATTSRRVLLLSADPAHSTGDVLGVAASDDGVAVAGVDVVEVDAPARWADTVARYRDRVDGLFDQLSRGSRFDAVYDRAVVKDLIDLAPPGIDELLAVTSVIDALFDGDAAARHDVVVVDAAPTGHALRLLQMPALALDWVHAFLSLLLKYKEVTGLGDVARELLTTARQLKQLIALLHDRQRCAVVVVTRPAALPVDETRRLLRSLDDAGLGAAFVVINGLSSGDGPRCRRRAGAERTQLRRLRLSLAGRRVVEIPLAPLPPVGVAALDAWRATWRLTP
jgi:arsenite-transporting ATPase